jgi:hypothetical protein
MPPWVRLAAARDGADLMKVRARVRKNRQGGFPGLPWSTFVDWMPDDGFEWYPAGSGWYHTARDAWADLERLKRDAIRARAWIDALPEGPR